MKHFYILCTFLSCVIFANAESKGRCGETLEWRLTDSGELIISGQGPMKDYGADNTPWNTYMVKTLTVSEGITHIGSNAFSHSRIYNASLPTGVTSIGNKAFANCGNLTSLQLPYGLVSIGDDAFSGCKNLAKIDLPASLRIIGKKAFKNCSTIQNLAISNRLEALGSDAFVGCKNLHSFSSLPDFVTPVTASRYGLPSRVVDNFYEKRTNISEEVPVSVENSVPQTSDNRKADTHGKIEAGVSYGESDVDRLGVSKPQNNSNTFVFIIANENYSSFPDVPFALNDGNSFRKYCLNVLGVPNRNITFEQNATLGTIYQTIEYLKQIDEAYKGDLSFIIYYAGHGAPDEKNNKAYLIPSDAHAVTSKTCYPLDDLYAELGSLKAQSVKVFMDACFSGTGRTDDMLAQGGRSVRTVPKKSALTGNVVVVSATSNDQTAWHYKDEGHGLFTYCLLKKLQETGGDLTMGELCDYLENEVPKMSIVINRTAQTPTSQHAATIGNKWRLWQVKK